MQKTNLEERSIAEALLKRGYEKAAESFSKIARQHVSITQTSVEIAHSKYEMLPKLKKDEELVLITTAIIGQLQGKSYLILNYDECDEIFRSCLDFNNSQYKNLIETETFLKELDNIISATVITEFSNYLDVMVYGDVPVLSKTNITAIKEKLVSDLSQREDDTFFILSNAKFVFENNSELQPQFIWKLKGEFMQRIKEISLTSKRISL